MTAITRRLNKVTRRENCGSFAQALPVEQPATKTHFYMVSSATVI